MPSFFLTEFIFICARTSVLELPFLIKFRFAFSLGFLALNSLHVIVLLTLLFSRLYLKQCQQMEFEIVSVKVLNKITVPLLFRCSLDLFKCFYVIILPWVISSKFLSMHKVFRYLFTCTTFFRYLSFLAVMLEIATLHEFDFNEDAKSIIDSTTFSGGIFVVRSFVPTCKMM